MSSYPVDSSKGLIVPFRGADAVLETRKVVCESLHILGRTMTVIHYAIHLRSTFYSTRRDQYSRPLDQHLSRGLGYLVVDLTWIYAKDAEQEVSRGIGRLSTAAVAKRTE